MKKMIYSGCILGLIYSLPAIGTPPFIIEKKSRNLSCSKLKEQAIDQLGDTLRLVPSLLRQIADIQEQVQAALEAYITGQKGCFWDTAGKDQLQLCCTKTEHCKAQLEGLSKELADFAAYTKKLG